MAAEATGRLSGLQMRPATHRLHAPPALVKQLEVDGVQCRATEQARSVGVYIHLADDMFHIPAAAKRDRLARPVPVVGDEVVEAALAGGSLPKWREMARIR